MKALLSWIREFVEVAVSPTELARKLTSAGLNVETVTEAPGGDAVFDIEVFSNRPDCMNIYGIAREVAAATGKRLCPYPGDLPETTSAPQASSLARVSIDEPELCRRYTGRVVQGVRIGPSPDWLAGRLVAAGLRPVNNVVDATNYVLWEFGHPLHAFDLAKLEGREIRVRLARKGELIRTLDEVPRSLDPEILVIADARRPVALAGIMGGFDTMVTGRTTDLLIESAHFDAVRVRRASKKLGLSTDASYRFERGADIEATLVALNRAAGLIQQVAGGTICRGVLEAGGPAPPPRRVRLRAARVSMLLGVPVDSGSIAQKLEALQLGVQRARDASGQDLFDVEIPSHRQDIDREVDLIEEVARSIGYESVPERLPNIAGAGGVNRSGHRQETRIRQALSAAGFHEAVTTSFGTAPVDWGLRQRLDPRERAIEPIALANPIATDQEILRTTILPGLLAAVARNLSHGNRDVRLFEIGRTFRRGEPAPASHEQRKRHNAGPVEEIVELGAALTGGARPPHWAEPARETTFFDLKGVVESMITQVGLRASFEPLPPAEALEGGRSASIAVEGRRLGRMGSLSRSWRERLEIRHETYVAELNLSELFALPERPATYDALPRYPAVSRDLSLVVSRGQRYADLEEAIRGAAPDLVSRVWLFDRYAAESLPPGTMGLSINVIFQHPERTLASEEVGKLQERIVKTLSERFGARLRG